MTTIQDRAQGQAIAQFESIRAMVERLKHARDCADPGCTEHNAEITASEDYHDEDDARETIQEDPLSVEVRSGWASGGDALKPEEFQILLCTGGPAVRMMGELDEYQEPSRAWLEYQDWGTPWMQLFTDVDQVTLLAYAQEFYYGG